MNVDKILAVADAIEQHTIPGLGFNMMTVRAYALPVRPDLSGHNCRTVACIAGWTLALEGRRGSCAANYPGALMDAAGRVLGLDDYEELFVPLGFEDSIHTDKHAVRVLRNLAITGKVDWEAAMKDNDPVMPALPQPAAADPIAA